MRPRIVGLHSHHPVGLGERLFGGGGIAGLPLVGDVVALVFEIGANDRRIRFEALHRVGDGGQRVVVDDHSIGTVAADVWVGGDDRGHLLALVSDLVRGQHRLGVSGQGRHPRQVVFSKQLTRYHSDHAVDGFGSGGVDAVDRGVRPRTAYQRHVQHPGKHDVVDKGACALDEAVVLVPLDVVADAANLGGRYRLVVVGCRCHESLPAVAILPASWIDLTMLTYPVHRHRLPEMAHRTSSSVGFGLSSMSLDPTSIIAGVQKPH